MPRAAADRFKGNPPKENYGQQGPNNKRGRAVCIDRASLHHFAGGIRQLCRRRRGRALALFCSAEQSAGHYNEWIKACKGAGEALCNFEYSGSLIEHNLLGNAAHRAGKALEWDAKKFEVTNDEEANKLLTKEYRKGWEPS